MMLPVVLLSRNSFLTVHREHLVNLVGSGQQSLRPNRFHFYFHVFLEDERSMFKFVGLLLEPLCWRNMRGMRLFELVFLLRF